MFLLYNVFIILLITLYISTIIVLGWIFKKMGKPAGLGGIIGFIVGFFIVIFTAFFSRNVYIIEENGKCIRYTVYGNPEYVTKQEKNIIVTLSNENCLLINDSEKTFFVEEVVYGGIFAGKEMEITPFSEVILTPSTIDYFFAHDPPPEEISSNSEKEVRLWIKTANE